MSTSIGSNDRWMGPIEDRRGREPNIVTISAEGKRARSRTTFRGVLRDLALAVLVVLSGVLAIVLIGVPIALFVRLLIEIVERLL